MCVMYSSRAVVPKRPPVAAGPLPLLGTLLLLLLAAPPADSTPTLNSLAPSEPTTPTVQQYMYTWSSLLLSQLEQVQRARGGAPLAIAYVGDSTVRQQLRTLCLALSAPPSPAAFDLQSIMANEDAALGSCRSERLNISAVHVRAGCLEGRLRQAAAAVVEKGARACVPAQRCLCKRVSRWSRLSIAIALQYGDRCHGTLLAPQVRLTSWSSTTGCTCST